MASLQRTIIRAQKRDFPHIYKAIRRGKLITVKRKNGKRRTDQATASMKGTTPEAIAKGIKKRKYWENNPILVRRRSGVYKTEAQEAREKRKLARKGA